MKVSKQYRPEFFHYPEYDQEQQELPVPENTPFELRDVVYIKPTNSIGVVLGLINYKRQTLRTDMEGMRTFDELEPVTEQHIRSGAAMSKSLFMEIANSQILSQ